MTSSRTIRSRAKSDSGAKSQTSSAWSRFSIEECRASAAKTSLSKTRIERLCHQRSLRRQIGTRSNHKCLRKQRISPWSRQKLNRWPKSVKWLRQWSNQRSAQIYSSKPRMTMQLNRNRKQTKTVHIITILCHHRGATVGVLKANRIRLFRRKQLYSMNKIWCRSLSQKVQCTIRRSSNKQCWLSKNSLSQHRGR